MVFAAGLDPPVLAGLRSRVKGKIVITNRPGRSVADEELAGADVVLYYGFLVYAAYHGVKTALDTLMRTRNAGDIVQVRASIAEFESFIGYPGFSERAKKYGLG